jgi:hypothetical protein
MGGTPDQPKEVAKPSNGGGFIALAIGLAFLITGLGSGIPGIHAALQDRQIIAGGVHAAGEVIRVEFRSSRYKVSAVQEVTFPAKNGEIYTAEARERYSKRNDPPRPVFAEGLIGNELTVFYDPSDPARNVVEDNEHSLASPWSF